MAKHVFPMNNFFYYMAKNNFPRNNIFFSLWPIFNFFQKSIFRVSDLPTVKITIELTNAYHRKVNWVELVARTQQTSRYQPINELELDLTFSASRGGVPALVNSIVFRTLLSFQAMNFHRSRAFSLISVDYRVYAQVPRQVECCCQRVRVSCIHGRKSGGNLKRKRSIITKQKQ